MPKSKITDITFKSSIGDLNVFSVKFENEVFGDVIYKENPPAEISVGQEVEYTVTENPNPKYAPKIKIVRKKEFSAFGTAKNQTMENKRMALRCATDLVIAGKNQDLKILPLAETLFHFLEK